MEKKKSSKKCRTEGFVTNCSECRKAFVASAHVTPKCGGGLQEHDDHDSRDCCGFGDHTERREGLVCTDCVFNRNIRSLT